MDDRDFRTKFLTFIKLYNQEKAMITPLMSINSKSVNELKNEIKDLVSSLFAICRLHYITMTTRIFSVEELCFPLKAIKPMSLSASLGLFKKPNHKDRYSYLVYFLTNNVTTFAQIVYYELSLSCSNDFSNQLLTEDDMFFFCYNTFPACFNFFIYTQDKNNGIDFITSILKLHIFIRGKTINKTNAFIKHLVASFFLATNPGRFYENSLLPLISYTANKVNGKNFNYINNDNLLYRGKYWEHISNFIDSLINGMLKAAPLLPNPARNLLAAILDVNEEFGTSLIVETMICMYIENFTFVHSQGLVQDVCRLIRAAVYNDINPLTKHLQKSIELHKFDFKNLVHRLASAPKSDRISEAVDVAEKTSLFTPRDLTLLYKTVTAFLHVSDSTKSQKLKDAISGLDQPSSDLDTQFILVHPWGSDSLLGKAASSMKSTSGFDEFVDLVNKISIDDVDFMTPQQLSEIVLSFTGTNVGATQCLILKKCTLNFSNAQNALEAIESNHKLLQEVSDKISDALFFVHAERKRHAEQNDALCLAFSAARVLPAVVDAFPTDFSFDDADIFSPTKSYNFLIESVTARVDSLGVEERHRFVLRKLFFMDFFDRIDGAFGFMSRAKTSHLSVTMANFCQDSHGPVDGATEHVRDLIARAGQLMQNVDVGQSISHNLDVVLGAMRLLETVDDRLVQVSIALSANIDLFAFSYFVGGYIKDERIVDMVMTEKDQYAMKRFRQALQEVGGKINMF